MNSVKIKVHSSQKTYDEFVKLLKELLFIVVEKEDQSVIIKTDMDLFQLPIYIFDKTTNIENIDGLGLFFENIEPLNLSLDDLLDKVHDNGLKSLNEEEMELLNEYSK